MRRYFNRIFEEASEEFEKGKLNSLPFIEALAVMIIVSRGMAEAIEIFPYSISKFLVNLAYNWSLYTTPFIDRVYKSIGYLFAPDVSLIPHFPPNNPKYPLCSWMISLWLFSILYTFSYWFILTGVSYLLCRTLRGKGSYFKLLVMIGLAHIPMINWWFYTGCEMLYEIVQQHVYLSITPPYYKSAVKIYIPTPLGNLPSYLPIEGFWAGFGFGVYSMILTIGLIIVFIKRSMNINYKQSFLASLPWLIYLILILIGSLNVNEITAILNDFVKKKIAWSWLRK